MSTFMANKGNIERKWYVLDAAGAAYDEFLLAPAGTGSHDRWLAILLDAGAPSFRDSADGIRRCDVGDIAAGGETQSSSYASC